MVEDRILERVRKLMDRANHPNTPEAERESCFRKADQMMVSYAIDQALLDTHLTGNEKRFPVTERIHAFDKTPWKFKFQTMLGAIAQTCRLRVALHYNGDVTLVGMSEDVDYFQLLWTSVYLGFVSRLEPRWQSNLSFEHNVYNLKVAGIKWQRIADVANANSVYVEWPDGGRLIRAYRKHCKMIGEEPKNHTQRHEAYRESFAEGYVRTICARLEGLRSSADEAYKGSGAELAIRDMRQEIDEEFYSLFPHLRPMSDEEADRILAEARAAAERKAAAEAERVAAMSPQEREDYEREKEAKRREQAKADQKFWREQDREYQRTHDDDGSRAGRSAGQQVDFYDHTSVGRSSSAGELS